MMVAALWLSGTLAGVALFMVLQGLIQRKLALAHEGVQGLAGRAVAWNSLIVLVASTFLFALAGAYGLAICLVLIALLFMLNKGLFAYFGRVTTKGDLASIREAAVFLPSLLRHPRYAVGAVLLALGVWVVAAGAEELNRHVAFAATSAWPARSLALLISAMGGAFLFVKGSRWPVLNHPLAASWTDQNANVRKLGFLLQFLLLLVGLRRIPRPPSIDRDVDRLLQSQPHEAVALGQPDDRPDVIFLMMESLADLGEMGIPLAVDPLMQFKQARDGTACGHLGVKVIGGNTCDTEFEVLTGISVGERGVAAQPFMGNMNPSVYSLAHALRRHGYRATAVHPFHRWFYNRDRVYKRFGIQEFLADESFVGAERLFDKVSDQAFVDKVLTALKPDAPNFLFGVSILGHGPYLGASAGDVEYLAPGAIDDPRLRSAINHYCALMAMADAALERLRLALVNRDKPFVLVVFGDHVPVFSNDLRGQEVWEDIFRWTKADALPANVLHRTPLAVTSNVPGVATAPLGEIAASDLAARVLALLGMADPGAFGALREDALDDASARAYAYDTVHGEQRLTARFLVRDGSPVDRVTRERYRKFTADKNRLAALSDAIRRGDTERADRFYAQFGAQDVLFGDASLLWALMRVRAGIDDEAVRQAFEAAATQATDPFYAFYHRIVWEVSLGFLDAVRRDVQRAIRISPGRVHELRSIARQLFGSGNAKASEAILDEIADAGVELGSEKVIWASLKLDAGRTDIQVEQVLVEAAHEPDPFWARYHCIRLYALRGDEASVASCTSAALELAPPMASTLVELAREQFTQGRTTAALAILDLVARSDVDWHTGYVLWAALRIDAGRIDDNVERTLLDAVQEPAGGFWACYHCVRLYGRQGNLAGLARMVGIAIDRHPDMLTHLLALAQQEFVDSRPSVSLAILDVAVDQGCDLGFTKVLWASLRIDARIIDSSVDCTLELATREPDNFWAWYHRIRLYGVQGNQQAMEVCRDAVIRLHPERAAEVEHLLAQFRP
jgi:hypothetical protein